MFSENVSKTERQAEPNLPTRSRPHRAGFLDVGVGVPFSSIRKIKLSQTYPFPRNRYRSGKVVAFIQSYPTDAIAREAWILRRSGKRAGGRWMEAVASGRQASLNRLRLSRAVQPVVILCARRTNRFLCCNHFFVIRNCDQPYRQSWRE